MSYREVVMRRSWAVFGRYDRSIAEFKRNGLCCK